MVKWEKIISMTGKAPALHGINFHQPVGRLNKASRKKVSKTFAKLSDKICLTVEV